MIHTGLFVMLLASVSSSDGGLPTQMVVEGLEPRLEEFDGKRVQVRGTVHECTVTSCRIEGVDGSAISIGPDEEFDRAISKYLGRAVTIEATVNAECLSGTLLCLDRAGVLRNPVLFFPRN